MSSSPSRVVSCSVRTPARLIEAKVLLPGASVLAPAALAIARRAAAHTAPRDVPLCHGAAGLAHVFGRLAAATGDEPLTTAAAHLMERPLALRDPDQPIAGFPFATPNGPTARPGLVEGAAGVALALLSGSEPAAAGWDRFLLLSTPGLP